MIIITRKEQESPRGQLRGNNITCAKRLFLTKRQVCAQQYGTQYSSHRYTYSVDTCDDVMVTCTHGIDTVPGLCYMYVDITFNVYTGLCSRYLYYPVPVPWYRAREVLY